MKEISEHQSFKPLSLIEYTLLLKAVIEDQIENDSHLKNQNWKPIVTSIHPGSLDENNGLCGINVYMIHTSKMIHSQKYGSLESDYYHGRFYEPQYIIIPYGNQEFQSEILLQISISALSSNSISNITTAQIFSRPSLSKHVSSRLFYPSLVFSSCLVNIKESSQIFSSLHTKFRPSLICTIKEKYVL